MQDQTWAQTPHSLPGRIKEEMGKARKTEDGKVTYNGVKGDVVQSSQWMDVGQSKVK